MLSKVISYLSLLSVIIISGLPLALIQMGAWISMFEEFYEKGFCVLDEEDFELPLNAIGMAPKWQNFNKNFYEEKDFIYYYDYKKGKYNINVRVTSFNRVLLTSLVLKQKKTKDINLKNHEVSKQLKHKYNRYKKSLLKDKAFFTKLKKN